MTDRLLESLRRLPAREPGEARAARTRTRCRATLLAHRKRSVQGTTNGRLWPPLAGTACAIYLGAAILETLRVYGVL